MNTKEFVARCEVVNKDRYDYSLVEYVRSQIKVTIICKKHGKFRQIPAGHIQGKEGCKTCVKLKQVALGLRLPLLD